MNDQEKQLADQILKKAIDPPVIQGGREIRLNEYHILMAAVKDRCDAELSEVAAFEIIQSLDYCEDCGDLI